MDRGTYVLAALAAEARFDPVRLQKFFFLLDRELEGWCGCPHFDFWPWRHGPFDQAVYGDLETLARRGLARIDETRRYPLYGLTEKGFSDGVRTLADLPQGARSYMAAASEWILSLDFRDLLAAIYEYAPDMAVRSVPPSVARASRSGSGTHPFVRGMARSFAWPGSRSRRASARSDATAATLGRHWAAVGDRLRAAMAQAATVHDGR